MEKIEIKSYPEHKLEEMGVLSWPVWEKEVSRFNWFYEAEEHCYILEGEVEVMAGGKTWDIKAGDYVIFKSGLSCTWNIKVAIRKHYNFT